MMKALVYTGVEEMEFREEKEPSEKPGESILKVHASGICGCYVNANGGCDRCGKLNTGDVNSCASFAKKTKPKAA